jgi:hypothetical protein
LYCRKQRKKLEIIESQLNTIELKRGSIEDLDESLEDLKLQ